MSLTPKQAAFVAEYLVDLNATQAAIRAGYSAKSAYSQGERLLRNDEVQCAVISAKAERSDRTEITADRVLQELSRIAFSDLRGILTPGGSLLNLADVSDALAPAVAAIKVVTRKQPGAGDDAETEYFSEVKLWDKMSALDKLGKHLGMFRDTLDVTLTTDLAAVLRERKAARRAAGGGSGG